MLVTGDDSRSESRCRNRKTDDSSSNQPQSFGDFAHGTYTSRRPYTKLTYSFSYHRSKGTSLPPPSETRYRTPQGTNRSLANPNQTKWKSTTCACFPYYYTIYNTSSQPKGTTKPTVSLRTDDNGTPATWTLVLSSSKPLTGRTGLQSRRTLQLYWNHRRYHSLNRNTLPLPDKDSSQQQTTCLVGHPSIEATPCRTPSRKTPRRRQTSHRT